MSHCRSTPLISDTEYVELVAMTLVSEIYALDTEERIPEVVQIVAELTANAVGSFRNSRTVAQVIRRMTELLRVGSDENVRLRIEAMDVAFATFINCWRREFTGQFRNLSLSQSSASRSSDSDNAEVFLKVADPYSAAAYVGELYAAEIMPAPCFEYTIRYIATQLTDPFHLDCLEQMLVRGTGDKAPTPNPSFLLEMLNYKEKRLSRCFYRLIDQAGPFHDKELLIEHRIAMFIRRHRTPAWKRRSVSRSSDSSGSATAINSGASSPSLSIDTGSSSPASIELPLGPEPEVPIPI